MKAIHLISFSSNKNGSLQPKQLTQKTETWIQRNTERLQPIVPKHIYKTVSDDDGDEVCLTHSYQSSGSPNFFHRFFRGDPCVRSLYCICEEISKLLFVFRMCGATF